MPARWLIALSWIELGAGVAGTLRIASDILRGGYRQPMAVMDWVWPVTALCHGPIAVWAYGYWGRTRIPRWIASQPAPAPPPADESWVSSAIGVCHCGAGHTLGDIAVELTVFGFGIDIAGQRILADYAGDYLAAVALGLVFQYFAIAPMRGLGLRDGIRAGVKEAM